MEEKLEIFYELEGVGFLSNISKAKVASLERRRKKLLADN